MATRDPTPPPLIGKAGRYTVFITPSDSSRSHTPSPKSAPPQLSRSYSSIPRTKLNKVHSPPVHPPPPVQHPLPPPPPPVQVPPPQYAKSGGKSKGSGASGFFWHAVARVQDAHSSLDAYLAYWLGLNQSRYQWALNDYYENNPAGKEGGKPKELVHKGQSV